MFYNFRWQNAYGFAAQFHATDSFLHISVLSSWISMVSLLSLFLTNFSLRLYLCVVCVRNVIKKNNKDNKWWSLINYKDIFSRVRRQKPNVFTQNSVTIFVCQCPVWNIKKKTESMVTNCSAKKRDRMLNFEFNKNYKLETIRMQWIRLAFSCKCIHQFKIYSYIMSERKWGEKRWSSDMCCSQHRKR